MLNQCSINAQSVLKSSVLNPLPFYGMTELRLLVKDLEIGDFRFLLDLVIYDESFRERQGTRY